MKTSATATDIDNKVTEYVLALATLGDATRNRNNLIGVAQPKVAKSSTMVSVACSCRRCYHDKLCQCKYGFKLKNVSADLCGRKTEVGRSFRFVYQRLV